MSLRLPPKRQQRRGGPDLCWQTVPRPRRCHRKGAVASQWEVHSAGQAEGGHVTGGDLSFQRSSCHLGHFILSHCSRTENSLTRQYRLFFLHCSDTVDGATGRTSGLHDCTLRSTLQKSSTNLIVNSSPRSSILLLLLLIIIIIDDCGRRRTPLCPHFL